MAWVTEPSVEVKVSFTDASGHRATESYFMDGSETDPTTGGPAALATALAGLTNNGITLLEVMIRAAENAPGTPTDGPYSRGADKALLVFQAADGSEVNMEIGAPNEGILQSDKINVDKADTAIDELLTAMKTYCVTAEGQPIKVLKRGFRKRNAGAYHL